MNAGAGGQDMAGVVTEALLVGPHGSERWDAARLALNYRRSAVPRDRVVAAAWLRFGPGDPKELEDTLRRRLDERRRAQGVGRPNAGSVFKNPPGGSAWRLIDRVGLRGRGIGGAQVSDKHSNFIVNCGGARASDVLALMEDIRQRVQADSGILLEPEVRVVGEA
jgi:UDP-N-acetylmuramate dehydrogenase